MNQVMAAQAAMLPALEATSLQIQSCIQSSADAHTTTLERAEEVRIKTLVGSSNTTN
jgi:hypothetical protein